MSKILFWSPYHGQGQTSNLYAIALIFGIIYKKQVLLTQTHFKYNNLESPLVGRNVDKQSDEGEIFEDIGIDMAVTYSNMNYLNKRTLENCCLTFLDSLILMMPGTKANNKETFDREIGGSMNRLIKAASEYMDLVFIDSNSGCDDLSLCLMSTADLIVVNLSQHRYVLENFFAEYGERFKNDKRIFYLFGDYDDNSGYNIDNCRRKFNNYMKSFNSGVIPYCTKYMDAQNESNVIRFFQEGMLKRRKHSLIVQFKWRYTNMKKGIYTQDETEYFFRSALSCADKIIALLHIPVKKNFRG